MELDDAFANGPYIPGGANYPVKWAAEAAAYRMQARADLDVPYGSRPRERFDVFYPEGVAKGLLIFVHGGYWRMFSKSDWSHLAAGPVAQGWAVALPSYDLCPDVRIGQIGDQIATAIGVAADRIPGPICLAGHSAGGQLVARAAARHTDASWYKRLRHVIPISPLGDLAPLMRTSMNSDLQIDAVEAASESPIHMPPPKARVTVWVGGSERPVFVEQAQDLAKRWGVGLTIQSGKHHFDVIEELTEPDTDLTKAVTSSSG